MHLDLKVPREKINLKEIFIKKLKERRRFFQLLVLILLLPLFILIVKIQQDIKSRASGSSLDIELEKAEILSSPAGIGSDSNASGGQYVQFGGTIIAPPPTGGFIEDLITDPSLVFSVPSISKPAYLSSFVDPTFHTKVTRFGGDSGTTFTALNGSGTWGSDVRQHYNDDQAWNADSSLIAIENRGGGTPNFVILDGETYQPKYVRCSNYDFYDHRWHPNLSHKNERIAVKGTTLQWFDVVNCKQTRVWTLPFSSQSDMSQNPSADGRYIALYDIASAKIFVVDMDPQVPFTSYDSGNKRIGPVFDLKANCGRPDCNVAHASISQSGKYIVVGYTPDDHRRILDVNLDTLEISVHQEPASAPVCPDPSNSNIKPDPSYGWVLDLGHEGIAYNPFDNNEEVIIGQRRSWCKTVDGVALGGVVMVRLKDGQVTSLTDPNNEAYPHHISTVNNNRPGWAYVSYYPGTGTRFAGEVIAVKMDGSKKVERFVHHHSNPPNAYRSEVHPVPSRDGRRIIFASDWTLNCGTTCGSSSNPQGYVVDARAQTNTVAGLPAFPKAEGWGAQAWQACDRSKLKVIEVTNLNDSGTGSLRAALTATSPRIVVFKVGGIIKLQSRIDVRDDRGQSCLYVAGQTAPGGGILVTTDPAVTSTSQSSIKVVAKDVIFRYVKMRGNNDGNIDIDNAKNVIFDHVSLSWTTDDSFDIWYGTTSYSGPISNVTLQRSTSSEIYDVHATHSNIGGEHSTGNEKQVSNISIHHNLLGHASHRYPNISAKAVSVINNVMYNWKYKATITKMGTTTDIIGNYYKPGPITRPQSSDLNSLTVYRPLMYESADANNIPFPDIGSIYVAQNIQTNPSFLDLNVDNWQLAWDSSLNKPLDAKFKRNPWQPLPPSPLPIKAESPFDAYTSLVTNKDVGANARLDCNGNKVINRDSVDERFLNDTANGTQWFNFTGSDGKPRFPDSLEEVGGYPTIDSGTSCSDSDNDGMPDQWESSQGFNPSLNDSALDRDGDGYTNIEEYINRI